ncbi:response regulator transcription factor [Streptomyces bacillaris]|uniref:response regulator transcription factor n=1 Tax=Streptomyces TaxID=1883 RepID=UPI0006AD405E|nr:MULTISPECIES: response regulator transcription factor [Streptomyces]QCW79986.1 response regulator transcription factor [Streptomyces sp. S6]WRX04079.1 ORF5 [Streptomyces sp.]ALC26482.1 response regulator, two-component system [Streptomyces sp. CFMR 7]MBT3072930.1 response regulator transcription factor [Streptomyces sp. COG21]MBT3081338.1 response regulator transcription factor [Streptomyces sp. COG20]
MAEKGRCGLLVLHSSPLIRKAILDLFRGDPGVTVLGGSPHPTALGSLPGRRPDVALVEYEQWQGVRGNLAHWSGTRVILYSRDNTPRSVVDCIRGGAAGFVHESCPPESIVKGLHDVLSGRSFWHLGADEPERAPVAPRADAGGQWKLSGREEEILGLLLRRRSNEEIAQELCLTQQTVKNYASRVFHKVGVSGRKELFRMLRPCG